MQEKKRLLAMLFAVALMFTDLGSFVVQATDNAGVKSTFDGSDVVISVDENQGYSNDDQSYTTGEDEVSYEIIGESGEEVWVSEPAVASIAFTPRTTAPTSDNHWYYSKDNVYYGTAYGPPTTNKNCTWYAYGRACEILGARAKCGINAKGASLAASAWYNNTIDGYARGTTPKLGAIACKGTHVAVVESINTSKNTMTLSNSAWQKSVFYISENVDCSKYTYIYLDEFSASNTAAPTITNATVSDINPSNGTYKVTATIVAEAGLNRVQFPTWTTSNDQDDLPANWVTSSVASGRVTSLGNNTYQAVFIVNISDHNNEYGYYNTHIYAYDSEGRYAKKECNNIDMNKAPVITKVELKDVNYIKGTYTVRVYVEDASIVDRVQFPTWTELNGQDDIASNWSENTSVRGSYYDQSSWIFRVNISDHNNEKGKYNTHIYVYSKTGQYVSYAVSVNLTAPKSGTWGDNINWVLSDDGVLGLSGEGAMLYGSTSSDTGADNYPWLPYLQQVKKIVIEEGITSINDSAFAGAKNLKTLELPSTLKSIRADAFGDCSSLKGTLILPPNITRIWQSSFQATGITDVVLTGDTILQGNPPMYAPEHDAGIKLMTSTGGLGSYAPNTEIETTTQPHERSYLYWYMHRYTSDMATHTVTEVRGEKGSFPDNTIIHYPSTWSSNASWDNSQTSWCGYTCVAQDTSGISNYGIGREVLPVGITLNKSSIDFVAGDAAQQLVATVLPAETTDKTVTWMSSDSNVATVNASGLVTPQGQGTAYIYAYVGNTSGSNLYAICRVTVLETLTISFVTGIGEEVVIINGIQPNMTIELPEDPEKEGYDFKGWYTKENGQGIQFTNETIVTEELTLYAFYTIKNCILTYDVNGGDKLSTSVKTIVYGAAYGALPTPARVNYTFAGWYTAAEGGEIVTENTICTKDATIYAHWTSTTENTCTATFESNGGTAVASQTVEKGKFFARPVDPVKNGYKFIGWYLEPTFVNQWDFDMYVAFGNVTFYAKWSQEQNQGGEEKPSSDIGDKEMEIALAGIIDDDGTPMLVDIIYTGSVYYNGRKHVATTAKESKTTYADIEIDVDSPVLEYASVKYVYKKNKDVTQNDTDTYFYISLKAQKGATKEQKKNIKAANKILKQAANRCYFKIIPFDVEDADENDVVVKMNKKATRITAVYVKVDGKLLKARKKKDYTYEMQDGEYTIYFTGNYTGELSN